MVARAFVQTWILGLGCPPQSPLIVAHNSSRICGKPSLSCWEPNTHAQLRTTLLQTSWWSVFTGSSSQLLRPPVNFGALAPQAGASPSPDIGIDTWPHKTAGHQALCCLYARVGHRVENCLTKTVWYTEPLDIGRYITDNGHSIRANGTISRCWTATEPGQGRLPVSMPMPNRRGIISVEGIDAEAGKGISSSIGMIPAHDAGPS